MKAATLITFNDVLIKPQFSNIDSRKDVDISSTLGNLSLRVPIFSANMDTVTNPELSVAMYKFGAMGCLHRFSSIEKNIKAYHNVKQFVADAVISVGLGDYEFKRAQDLIAEGAKLFCIDVAHGSQKAVVNQFNNIAKANADIDIIVGNFATGESVKYFRELCVREPLAFKVGIGGGSACLTRTQTGCGVPQLSALLDVLAINPNLNVISDGGKKTPGDIVKAIAAGAKAVMLGSMLAGTDESPGDIINGKFKRYRGSASEESYKDQGKIAKWRTYEGDSFLIPYKGPVKSVLQNIEGGLRSAFSYVGANNMQEFQAKAEFVLISNASMIENSAHGKTIR